MKILLLIVSFFLTVKTTGQSIEKITALLKEKDFITFKHFVDDHPKTNVDIKWEILRDVIPGYQEGVVKIVEYPLTGRDTDYTIHNYQIKLLSTKDSIFYYVLDKSYGKQIDDSSWKSFYKLIDSFNNQSAYHNFQTAFFDGYKAELDEKDLFLTSIVYGGGCGISGTPTKYQEILDNYLRNMDMDSIRLWLKSANSEKQLYALKGLKILKNEGYDITPEDNRLINIVKQKKGIVNTCSGCIFSSDTIKNIIEDMDTWQGDYYIFKQRPTKNKGIIYFGLLSLILVSAYIFFRSRRQS